MKWVGLSLMIAFQTLNAMEVSPKCQMELKCLEIN